MKAKNGFNLLIVDDEKDISDLIVFNAEQLGYNAVAVATGEDALKKAREEKPDLIVLDIMLPGIDGADVCRILRSDEDTSEIPIVMLTAKGSEEDIVKGLELGADDYVTKPFSPKVLFARIKKILQRKEKNRTENDKITYNEITVDQRKREVLVNGEKINLTFSEFETLLLLIKNRGWVFSRTEIVNNTKGEDYFVTERAVDVQIVGLRKKLGEAAKYIETVRGVGYRFIEI